MAIAPIIAWAGANAAGIGAIASGIGAVASVAGALKKPKAPPTPKVVPLPDENGAAARLRMLQSQQETRRRDGFGSTLVSGVLGDSSAPMVSQPLVFGRAA